MSSTPESQHRARNRHRPLGYRPQLLALEDRLPLGDSFLSSVLGMSLLGPSLIAQDSDSGAWQGAACAGETESRRPGQAAPFTAWLTDLTFSPVLEGQSSAPGSDSAETFMAPSARTFGEADATWRDWVTHAAVAGSSRPLGSDSELVNSLGSAAGGLAPIAREARTPDAAPSLGPSQGEAVGAAPSPPAPAAALPAPVAQPPVDQSGSPAPLLDAPQVRENYGRLPLSFEVNMGQTEAHVDFVARAPGYTLFLTGNEAVMAFSRPAAGIEDTSAASGPQTAREAGARGGAGATVLDSAVVRMELIGGNAAVQAIGRDELPGKVNYFRGDPSRWRTDIPTYAAVEYPGVYEGIDLVYYGNQRQLEYDFVVAPGADPNAITLGFAGADGMEISPEGDLVLHTPGGQVRQQRPVLYQELGGDRQAVSGSYVLKDQGHVGFEVGTYDLSRPLVIDPVLVYSTYLGGSEADEGLAIAVDSGRNAYLTGVARSTNFPTASPLQPAYGGGDSDAFVAKVNAAGTALVYATYLGGSAADVGQGIAVDSGGNTYVAGVTGSTNFPTTPGAFDVTAGGRDDGFVAKLGPTGSALIYSTYLAGNNFDASEAIAVDAGGNAHVAGWSFSNDFPTQNPFQSSRNGPGDATVTVVNAAGSGLLYSTYLGGQFQNDYSFGVAVDPAGNTYVTGSTDSNDFPTTAGAFQATQPGFESAFVAKVNPALSGAASLVYSTYLGGRRDEVGFLSGYDYGFGIAVDSSGNAFVTGQAFSTDFPVTPGAVQPIRGGTPSVLGGDAFVAKLNPVGTALAYATYLGGSADDRGEGIAVDAAGNAYVTGLTASPNFPTAMPLQPTPGGGSDAFVAKLNPAGTALAYATYLGGSADDRGEGIAIDAAGNAYVTGTVASTDFPTSFALQPAAGGVTDAFLAKIAETLPLAVRSFTATPSGFRIQFNQAINPATLNLYEAQAGGLGPADVLVTGDTRGPVRGSLAVNAAANEVTFIATGGPLPADRYTVALRSAADGFVTPGGGLLDGNDDGTPGDNYSATFTVASSTAVVVSVADFARGPRQPVDVPATATGIPLQLSNGSNVASVRLTLLYDPALLTPTGVARGSGVPVEATVSLDTSMPGMAVLTFDSPTALAPGPVTFATLSAMVPATAPSGARHVLDVTNLEVRSTGGQPLAARDDDGVHVVAFLGDATGNGAYTAADAQRVLRVAVGLDTGFTAYPLVDPVIIADVTGNGSLNATDATRILQEATGTDRPEIPPLP